MKGGMTIGRQIAPHPTLSPHRPIAQARWDLAGRGSETPCAVVEVMRPQLVHSLSPLLQRGGGGGGRKTFLARFSHEAEGKFGTRRCFGRVGSSIPAH